MVEKNVIIDVSEHNGAIDWAKVKAAGASAIIRCGYGRDFENQDDKWWLRNVRGATENGVTFGVYLYSYASDTTYICGEITHVRRLIEPLRGNKFFTLPVFLDLEEKSQEGIAGKLAREWESRAPGSLGHDTGIYASEYWWGEFLPLDLTGKKWVAKWSEKPPTVPWDFWQYTDAGKIPGVSGRVDMSLAKEAAGASVWVPPDKLADEVIAGKYGNGGARRKALGDRYDVVQAIVDCRLGALSAHSLDKLADDVIAGKYGNGDERRKMMGSIYDKVQHIVNQKLK